MWTICLLICSAYAQDGFRLSPHRAPGEGAYLAGPHFDESVTGSEDDGANYEYERDNAGESEETEATVRPRAAATAATIRPLVLPAPRAEYATTTEKFQIIRFGDNGVVTLDRPAKSLVKQEKSGGPSAGWKMPPPEELAPDIQQEPYPNPLVSNWSTAESGFGPGGDFDFRRAFSISLTQEELAEKFANASGNTAVMAHKRRKRQTWEQNELNRKRCMAQPTQEKSCGIETPVISVWIFLVKTLTCKEIRYMACGKTLNYFFSKKECMTACGATIREVAIGAYRAGTHHGKYESQSTIFTGLSESSSSLAMEDLGTVERGIDGTPYSCDFENCDDEGNPIPEKHWCDERPQVGFVPCSIKQYIRVYTYKLDRCKPLIYALCEDDGIEIGRRKLSKNKFASKEECLQLCQPPPPAPTLKRSHSEVPHSSEWFDVVNLPAKPYAGSPAAQKPKDSPAPKPNRLDGAKVAKKSMAEAAKQENDGERSTGCGSWVNERQCSAGPGVAGPCKAYLRRWSWVAVRRRCIAFVYGGCRGTLNNFETKEKCEETCKCGDGGDGGEGNHKKSQKAKVKDRTAGKAKANNNKNNKAKQAMARKKVKARSSGQNSYRRGNSHYEGQSVQQGKKGAGTKEKRTGGGKGGTKVKDAQKKSAGKEAQKGGKRNGPASKTTGQQSRPGHTRGKKGEKAQGKNPGNSKKRGGGGGKGGKGSKGKKGQAKKKGSDGKKGKTASGNGDGNANREYTQDESAKKRGKPWLKESGKGPVKGDGILSEGQEKGEAEYGYDMSY